MKATTMDRTAFARRRQQLAMEPMRKDAFVRSRQQTRAAAETLVLDRATTFSFVRETDGIEIYENASARRVKAMMHVDGGGGIAPFVDAFASQAGSSHTFRLAMFRYFRAAFSDGMHLHSHSTTGHHDLSLNWMAMTHQDTTYDVIFASATTVYQRDPRAGLIAMSRGDAKAAAVGVHVWDSVALRDLPPSTHMDRLTVTASGFVVEAIDESTIVVSFVLQINEPTSLEWQRRLAQAAVASFRTGLVVLVPPRLWTQHVFCYLCFKTFGAFARRHHCRLCGHAICSKCTSYVATQSLGVVQSDDPLAAIKASLPFCVPCGRGVDAPPQEKMRPSMAHEERKHSIRSTYVSSDAFSWRDDQDIVLHNSGMPRISQSRHTSNKSSRSSRRSSQS
ncbi:Aste57867_11453 [Aphanomyces stellatus]|uniref:Aste57867_11453 protein n=1 Tax=Aphanomyces stellatus TaxID=120398 RepID=A0A485KUW9_9STRA|nr:hypothetical protein As57867_011410 [Aphanomyces stellatus]VFT88314.1 Aste57867_11453 [Aphanomyces stellatus]